MKVTFIIKKAAKRYDTESTATIYVRFRNGRQLDSVAPTQLSINPNLWDDKGECVKTKACLLYTSPSPRDYAASRMPSSA